MLMCLVARVVLMVARGRYGCLVVENRVGRWFDGLEDFGEEACAAERASFMLCIAATYLLSVVESETISWRF